MKLIIEKHLNLTEVLSKINVWDIDFNIEYVDNIQDNSFVVSTNTDKSLSIIMPKKDGTAFIYDYNKHKDLTSGYAGGAFLNRFSVIVYGEETSEVLELRIVHEYLHSIGRPADDLDKNINKFLWFWQRWIYNWQKKSGLNPEHFPYWQKKFYSYLMGKNE